MYLGIEIGGTKLQLGVGRGDGEPLVHLERREVDIGQGSAGILRQIKEVASVLVPKYGIQSIGIGFGGPVDAARGVVIKSHQVAGWEDFPLVTWCRAEIGLSAVLGNDCDCAALAEAIYGAGRGKHCVFYVTVGTGIGGGLVIGGQLHGANRPAVAEIGHLRPGPDAADESETVESKAAGPGIAREGRTFLESLIAIHGSPLSAESAKRNSDLQLLRNLVKGGGEMTTRELADAAASGNTIARQILVDSIRTLGWAIAQVITLLAPDVVVVGGGVSLMGGKLFLEPLKYYVNEYVFPPLQGSYILASPTLGEEVVVHGALIRASRGA